VLRLVKLQMSGVDRMPVELKDFEEAVEGLRGHQAQVDAEIDRVQKALVDSGLRVTCWATNPNVRLNQAQLRDAERASKEHSPDGVDSDFANQIGANDDRYQLGFCEIDDKLKKRWCLAVRAVKAGEPSEPKRLSGQAPLPLQDAPYWVRTKAAAKLQELINAIARVAIALAVQVSDLRN
jgi:hypothetical protein